MTTVVGRTALATNAPVPCEALRSLELAHTSIANVEIVAAGAFKAPAQAYGGPAVDYSKLPAFCRVSGSINPTANSDIRFELWLPAAGWNGKFLQTGNGGAAGTVVYSSLVDPLMRGYAVANTDTGHQGAIGDFSWAHGHPEKITDFAYRATHELTIVGKAITAARYGAAPVKSYWNGCSTGGRQGLKEAQRYPEDYDAIIAGAPASNWSPLMALSVLIQRNMTAPGGLGTDKLTVLKEAAIAACDEKDGVKDRIISEPSRCQFSPASVQCPSGETGRCLTATEVAAATRIYGGVVGDSGRVLMPGTGPASEPLWAAYSSTQFRIGANYFRDIVAGDPQWDPATFNVDADLARAEAVDGGAIGAMDPDLSKFLLRGGKLITYHGTTDGLIPYGNSINYFESVSARVGKDKVTNGIRFYLVPGMDHCFGGEGAFEIDWLGALDSWAQTSHPPGALLGVHPAMPPGTRGTPPSGSPAFTRPICVYPQDVRYKGSGDISSAASFQCVAR